MTILERLPLVSIGVSTYNRKEYLRLCLDSLLAQTYRNCEIIVIDDGSSDGTDAMMAQCYPQVKYIRQENAGDAAAKNHAARAASGEYIVFNDSDDLFMPDCVERLLQALPEDGSTACSYGTYQTINAEGSWLPTRKKVPHYPSGNITEALLKHILVNCCGTLMPLELYRELGGFDQTLKVAHDYKFFLKLSLKCPFYAVQEPVFLRRRHNSNLSSSSYGKLNTAFGVFQEFIAENPDVATVYPHTVRLRTADYHSKLCREALHENAAADALFHAKRALKLKPGLKALCRLVKTMFKTGKSR